MFTPEERKQLDALVALGYIDAFRHKYPDKKQYTWWSYAFNSREKDTGWRIDYFFVTKSLLALVEDVFMQREVPGSDHGPLGIVLNKELEIKERPVYENQKAQLGLFG